MIELTRTFLCEEILLRGRGIGESVATQAYDSIGKFFNSFVTDFSSGWLLFGGPADVVLMLIDVLVSAAAIYFLLRLLNDSRAWQLLKGLIFIALFSILGNLLGLTTINYVLSNSLSLLAIGFVVIFQPEFRRALETVGRSSLRFVDAMSTDTQEQTASTNTMIDAIVTASERMASTKTGALIIIERKTKLGELVQGTAVVVDAAATSTFLEQVFYKGSPLHDGAVLIRNGRVFAARCHVPLSDTYHMRRDFGTRHRAAVGASEIGDAVAVVVSEERGKISLTVGGRLYPMENGDSLRVVLHKLFTSENERGPMRSLRGLFSNHQDENAISADAAGVLVPEVRKTSPRRRNRIFLQMISLLLAIALSAYVQITTNPIQETSLNAVNVQIAGIETLDEAGINFSLSDENILDIRLQSRSKYVERINRSNVVAKVDFSDLDLAAIQAEFAAGSTYSIQKMPITVTVTSLGDSAYKVLVRDPSELLVILNPAKE